MTPNATRHPESRSGDPAEEFWVALERWAATDVSGTAAELHAKLLPWLRGEQARRPESGLVHQACGRALEVAATARSSGADAPTARQHLARSCEAERSDLAAGRAGVATHACALLERGGFIATIGDAPETREAFLAAHARGLAPRAIVAESRPAFSGRELAAGLGAAGIPAWLVVDAALPLLLSQVRLVWIAAEAVTDRGAIVPVGGYAASLAAREAGVPVYLLAARRAFLPATTRGLTIAEQPPDEVWDDPPPGVRARSVRSEMLPLEMTRGVVVDDAVLGAGEAAQLARERPLPEPLGGTAI